MCFWHFSSSSPVCSESFFAIFSMAIGLPRKYFPSFFLYSSAMFCSIQMAVGYFLASFMSEEVGMGALMQARNSPSDGSSSDKPMAVFHQLLALLYMCFRRCRMPLLLLFLAVVHNLCCHQLPWLLMFRSKELFLMQVL